MKYFSVLLSLCILAIFPALSAVHHVTNSGFTFTPDTLTVQPGDTVLFSLATIHNAREVTQATWNANGLTSNGGFETAFGGGQVVLTNAGIYYYVCANHGGSGMKGTITVVTPTGVLSSGAGTPVQFALLQNYPNPFNPTTVIRYAVPVESSVRLSIYTINGDEIATLVDGIISAGKYSVEWNARKAASGTYLYRLEATGLSGRSLFRSEGKMILLK